MTWLRRTLRDKPLARAIAIRLSAAVQGARSQGSGGVLFLAYHDMRADEQKRFAQQIGRLRGFGDLVSVSAALSHLAGGTGRRVCLTFDDGWRGAFDHALPVLRDQAVPAGFFIVPGWLDAARPGVIGWKECRALHAAGMEIGSHSLSHRRLTDLSPAEVTHELVASRARIAAETDDPCLHFACPWGQPGVDYRSQTDPALARQAGYRSFFTTVQRRASPGADGWILPRVRMEPGWGAAELRYAFSRPM